jgi:hypothetical protein
LARQTRSSELFTETLAVNLTHTGATVYALGLSLCNSLHGIVGLVE